jgi:hypothetical protein
MITFPPSDPPLESYVNYLAQPPVAVLRWLVPGYRIMIGGNIQDAPDLAHLQKDFGITHVLDLESGRGATCEHAPGRYRKIEFVDNGMPMAPTLLVDACSYARDVLKAEGNRLYIHCHMGASRSPAIAYAILRSVYGLSHEDGLVAINRGFPHGEGYEWSHHAAQQSYVGAIDCWMDRGGLG